MALTRPRYSQIYDTDYKQSVRVATTTDVGNLLATGNMTNSVDGKTLVLNDRILVKDQNDAKQNGIYYVTVAGTGNNGTWVRAKDANASDKMTSGMTTIVSEGNNYAGRTFRLTTPDPITLGTTELTFADPFIVTATAGGANTHVQFNDINQLAGSAGFTFEKTANILTVTGNIVSTSGYFVGNGSQLSGIDATSIQSGTSNVKAYSSGNVAVSVNGSANIIVVSDTNTILTGNLLPSANVTYNLGSPAARFKTGYFDAGTIDLGGSTISVGAGGFVFTPAGGTETTLASNGSVTGTLLTAAQPNVTSLGNLTSLNVTGNVTASYLFGNGSQLIGIDATSIQNGTSNIRAFNSSSITVSIAGSPNVATFSSTGLTLAGNLTVSGTTTTVNSTTLDVADLNITVAKGAASAAAANGAGITVDGASATILYTSSTDTWNFNKGIVGTLNTGSQPNINSIGTLSSLVVTGNITTNSGKFIGDGSLLTGLPAGYTDSDVADYLPTHSGNVGASSVNATNLYGTIRTAAQTSITSVGTLTGLTVNGTTSLSSLSMTGNIGLASTGASEIASGTGDGASFTTYNFAIRSWWGIGFRDYQNLANVKAYLDTRAGSWGLKGTISVNGDNAATAIINGGTNGVGNIGASGAAFNTVFAKSTSAQYADLAEVYVGDKHYVPGTVVVFGGTQEVTVSTTSHDPSVAGVVSTNPAYLMNDTVDGVAVALQGRVPCRVLGPVNKGDRVVSSDVRGVAERLDMTKYQPGCIIGKSLESVPDNEIATIEVVVGRN